MVVGIYIRCNDCCNRVGDRMRTLPLLILCLSICVLVQSAVAYETSNENQSFTYTYTTYDAVTYNPIKEVTTEFVFNATTQEWVQGNVSEERLFSNETYYTSTDPYDFGDYPHAVQLTFIDKDTREPVPNESGKLMTHVYCDDFIKSLTGMDCREMYIDEAFLTDENGQTKKYFMSSFETWVSIRNVSVGFHPIQDAYIIGLF